MVLISTLLDMLLEGDYVINLREESLMATVCFMAASQPYPVFTLYIRSLGCPRDSHVQQTYSGIVKLHNIVFQATDCPSLPCCLHRRMILGRWSTTLFGVGVRISSESPSQAVFLDWEMRKVSAFTCVVGL